MRIRCLTHVPFEGPAAVADWAAHRGHTLAVTPLYEGAVAPAVDDFDWLVVMGGPMGVEDGDRYPWMAGERALIREAMDAGRTLVGICLGAQLIASVLGARVYPNPEREIGWMSVDLTPAGRASPLFASLPARLPVFQWHGDTFDLPPGALHLAASEACPHQAFLVGGRVLGLQFHLEATPGSVAELVTHGAADLVPGSHVQDAGRILAATPGDYGGLYGALCQVLDALADAGAGA